MRKVLPAAVCSCLLLCFASVSVSFGSGGLHDPTSQPGNGRLTVAVHTTGGWVGVGSPAFGKHPAEWVIDLPSLETPLPLRVRVSHHGATAAHIDSLLLDDLGPVEVLGASENDELAVIKAGGTDHDLIDVRGRSLVFVFEAAPDAGRLSLTARIEAARISKIPFLYPLDNLYGTVDQTSAFYAYALDSHWGRLEVDGDLEGEGLGEPFFSAFSKTGTGHPSGFTYGWVRNDDENLYVALDFVPDNTMDGAADYARVYVNTSSGVRRFEVPVPDQRWGVPGFDYTSRAAYQHKVYEFSIPLDELEMHRLSTASSLELAFAAYGTAAPPTCDIQVSALDVPDPVTAGSGPSNLTHTVTVTNAGPSDASGLTLAEVVTLPAGTSIVSITPSGTTTYAPANTAPGTWSVGNLAVGTSETLTIVMSVGAGTADGATVSSTATVTAANETLINSGDDSATENTTVQRRVDIQASALDVPDPVTAGSGPSNLTHTVTVTNAGPSDASGLTLAEVVTLPAGTSIVSITASGSTSYAPANASPGTWSVGNLAIGASETLTIVMTVGAGTAGGAIVSSTATVTSVNEPDINAANDSATESTSVIRLDDFGDAPDSYGTLLASNGARHSTLPGFSLGPIIDGEPDGQPSPLADGDDLNPPGSDDEDGVNLPPTLIVGASNSVTVVGSAAGMLDGWIDFNGNGVFDHPAEHLWAGTSQPLPPGPNPLTFSVPMGAVPGWTYGRFRLSSAGGLPPTGMAADGEVEDYRVQIGVSMGNIIIEKQTDPDGAAQSFEFSTSYGPNFFLSDDQTNNSGPLAAGVYSVSEVNIPASWSLTGATCDDGSDPSAIGLDPGETVTCVFENTSISDSDGDRIVDGDEGPPSEDRDGDGVPNYLDFDPSGYLYDEATGEILIGGSISVSGPGVITVLDDGSATGQYSWFHDGTQGDYILTVTYPPGYAASVVCPDLGVLNPDAIPDPLSLGAGENGSTGFLTSWDCGSNNYYSVLRVDATNPANIINNNIPLATLQPIPTLSGRSMLSLVLLLLVSGSMILRRQM